MRSLLGWGQTACLFSQRPGAALIEANHLSEFRLCSSSSAHNDGSPAAVPATFQRGWFSAQLGRLRRGGTALDPFLIFCTSPSIFPLDFLSSLSSSFFPCRRLELPQNSQAAKTQRKSFLGLKHTLTHTHKLPC